MSWATTLLFLRMVTRVVVVAFFGQTFLRIGEIACTGRLFHYHFGHIFTE